MDRKLTPTLALIVAGGLAAGIGLARPSNAGSAETTADTQQAAAAETPSAADGELQPGDDGYRAGNRAGNRGGTPADGQAAGGDQAPAEAEAAAPPAANEASITIQDFAFAGPATVAPGAQLTVTNQDSAAHTLTFRNGEADTGNLAGQASATITAPTAPGTYAFFCEIHPSMEGEITVAG